MQLRNAHYVDNKKLLQELSIHHELVKKAKAEGKKEGKE